MEVHQPFTAPVDGFERNSLWWRLHRIVEETAKIPSTRMTEVREIFDPLESRHMQAIRALLTHSSGNLEADWNQALQSQMENVTTAIDQIEHAWGLD
jgi:hypothetical protein